ncbi:MAG: SDR family oxidoreductase [Planctomycetes bacterium]|nr:SDR family oxidoreductase [Planctomycetota bacterium]
MTKAARHLVVTGAGTGIGRAIALGLAGKGTSLTLLARDVERLEATARLARARGAKAQSIACDIRERKLVDRAFAAAAARFGPVHVLVANSGIGGPNAAGPKDRFDDLVATNLVGTYSCLRAAQRHLAPHGAPRHFVVIASILARIGVANYSGYCASKSALLGLVRALAAELAPSGVQVNAVCPGWVNTEMARAGLEGIARDMDVSYERALEVAMQSVPLKRMSEPRDVAGLVRWLVSKDARGVTGQALDMNNGAWMG